MTNAPIDAQTAGAARTEPGSTVRSSTSAPQSRLVKLRAWLLVAVALLVASLAIPYFLQTWLWMRQLDYAGIFWKLLSVKAALLCATFVVVSLFLWLNVRYAARGSAAPADADAAEEPAGPEASRNTLSRALTSRIAVLPVAIFAAMFALVISTQWDTYLRFHYGGSFGMTDPIFGKDVGFYVFRLPWYELVQESLLALTIVTTLAVGAEYSLLSLMAGTKNGLLAKPAVRHLSLLLFVLAATLGCGYYLERFDLLNSTTGVVYGVGYTTAHVTLPALWVMIAVSVAACALLASTFLWPRWKAVAIGAVSFAALHVLGLLVAPALCQSFVVQPNELSLETPYLKHYIEFTRKAYNIEGIQETAYPAMTDLTAPALARNQDTIQNIRLWDKRPLLETYEQTQAIRLYYKFYGVHVDRYHLADGYHQVMLATRELSPDLPIKAQTWVNENLEFTHGYGLVMNFVSRSIGGGFPEYLVQNVPPQSSFGLDVTQPAIYYGEGMPGSRIVATGVKEFDYPKGNQNIYTSYSGHGGIPIDTVAKRLLFAWTQTDINILLTGYLLPGSRIQIWRDVQDRVARVAPFLKLDEELYPVLSEGRLYWIQDAYTVSKRFPYSNPRTAMFEDALNYMRNSVKVVVDAYEGTVSFYVMDPQDPVLGAYRRAFPGVFKDLRARRQTSRSKGIDRISRV